MNVPEMIPSSFLIDIIPQIILSFGMIVEIGLIKRVITNMCHPILANSFSNCGFIKTIKAKSGVKARINLMYLSPGIFPLKIKSLRNIIILFMDSLKQNLLKNSKFLIFELLG